MIETELRTLGNQMHMFQSYGDPMDKPDWKQEWPYYDQLKRLKNALRVTEAWTSRVAEWPRITDAQKIEVTQLIVGHNEPPPDSSTVAQVTVAKFLDIIELPFWKDRWRTYEVWVSVKVIEAIREFSPQLNIIDGALGLDNTSHTLICSFDATNKCFLHSQAQTDLVLDKRKAIRPDLRFDLNEKPTNDSTVCIVEVKQRHELKIGHLAEVAAAYRAGCHEDGGVVIVNYDELPAIDRPLEAIVLGTVRPGHPDQIVAMQDAVRSYLHACDVRPVPQASESTADQDFDVNAVGQETTKPDEKSIQVESNAALPCAQPLRIVLLDVSEATIAAYETEEGRLGLVFLKDLKGVWFYKFSGILHKKMWNGRPDNLRPGVGHDLIGAIQEVVRRRGVPDRLLVVTEWLYSDKYLIDHLPDLPGIRCVKPDILFLECDWLETTSSGEYVWG